MIKKTDKPSWTDRWRQDKAITVATLSSKADPEYVAWIDLMGATGWMAGSIRKAAEIIGLIHIAGLRAAKDHMVKVYPVVDGIYLVGEYKNEFRAATREVMRSLALTFFFRQNKDRFLVRGGIAYGRILHGEHIAELHGDLKDDSDYANCLAIGISIGQAYAAEKHSPPFGYFVDMTARSTARFNEVPYTTAFFRWWSDKIPAERDIAKQFGKALNEHFDYLNSRHRELEYNPERLKEHRLLAREYFSLANDPPVADGQTAQ